MILTDYFRSTRDATWDFALQCGVKHGVIRLPEEDDFDVTDFSHWQSVYKRFTDFGITPLIIEPMPNSLHDHIKVGDEKRDECIEKVIRMLPIMERLGIESICFNFMAHIGWLRTRSDIPERGGALVTGFDLEEFEDTGKVISGQTLWRNYEYFIRAVIPQAEKHGIRLALHPDDPPLERLGGVERIITSADNIERAISLVKSDSLGITMCQATFLMMGENLEECVERFRDKIFFIHFRNAVGSRERFNETFHDNGLIDMARMIRIYRKNGISVPIRVDHVPLMYGEKQETAGYTALGRLYAIGYLKGILEATEKE